MKKESSTSFVPEYVTRKSAAMLIPGVSKNFCSLSGVSNPDEPNNPCSKTNVPKIAGIATAFSTPLNAVPLLFNEILLNIREPIRVTGSKSDNAVVDCVMFII